MKTLFVIFALVILVLIVSSTQSDTPTPTTTEQTSENPVLEKCKAVYKNTYDKRSADLTTRENDQIAACTMIGIYPPPSK